MYYYLHKFTTLFLFVLSLKLQWLGRYTVSNVVCLFTLFLMMVSNCEYQLHLNFGRSADVVVLPQPLACQLIHTSTTRRTLCGTTKLWSWSHNTFHTTSEYLVAHVWFKCAFVIRRSSGSSLGTLLLAFPTAKDSNMPIHEISY